MFTDSFVHSLYQRQGSSSLVGSKSRVIVGNGRSHLKLEIESNVQVQHGKGARTSRKRLGAFNLAKGGLKRWTKAHHWIKKKYMYRFMDLLFGGLSYGSGIRQPNIFWPLICLRPSTWLRLATMSTQSGWLENYSPFLGVGWSLRNGSLAETLGVLSLSGGRGRAMEQEQPMPQARINVRKRTLPWEGQWETGLHKGRELVYAKSSYAVWNWDNLNTPSSTVQLLSHSVLSEVFHVILFSSSKGNLLNLQQSEIQFFTFTKPPKMLINQKLIK